MSADHRIVGSRLQIVAVILSAVACAPQTIPVTAPSVTASFPVSATSPLATEPAAVATTVSSTSTSQLVTSSTAAQTTTTLATLQGLELVTVADGFDQPVLVLSPPGGDERLFVVERGGRIRIVGNDSPFLDIDERVNSEDGIEPGLLGMAFHPDYSDNGVFYLYYYRADSPRTQLSSFQVSSDADVADPGSERELMAFDKPTNRHNGGMLVFDEESRLFLTLGEGGAASVNAQDPRTPLGSILRFDLTDDAGLEPALENPFVGREEDGLAEVWAYGLRNPWRASIDPVDDLLYIGDVGQEDWEEIDVIATGGEGGVNLGWLEMEGMHCFQPDCDPEAFTMPVLEYSHEEGCSVTGGVVYRGMAIPELHGTYFYGDWCGEWIRSFRLVDGQPTDQIERFVDVGQINGFGTDSAGELYVVTYGGSLLRMDPVR